MKFKLFQLFLGRCITQNNMVFIAMIYFFRKFGDSRIQSINLCVQRFAYAFHVVYKNFNRQRHSAATIKQQIVMDTYNAMLFVLIAQYLILFIGVVMP